MAASPLALVAYLATVATWTLVAWRVGTIPTAGGGALDSNFDEIVVLNVTYLHASICCGWRGFGSVLNR